MSDQYAVDIAVLREQINGLREQQKAHAVETSVRFSKVDEKLDSLIAVMNRGKGAFAASLALSGIIGGAVVKGASWLWPHN